MIEDVVALAAMARDSAGPGERAAADWIAGRLRDSGVADVAVEPFRYQRTYALAHGLHAAAGLVGGIASLAALVSLELEASGRWQWIRRLLPKADGANVVARIPAAGTARRTLVLVAHHDAANTGLNWRLTRPWRPSAKSMGAFMAPTALGFVLAASRRFRHLGRALLALSIAADADIARSPTVPGASDNATGVAALIELARRPLPEGLELWLVSCGCEEAGMGGMRAFLEAHRAELDPGTTFVLGLDTLGAGTPIIARAEGTMLAHTYAESDLQVVEAGARRAGLEPPGRWRLGGWTDPILARFAGYRCACLLSVGPDGMFTNYHLPTDTPDNVDFDCVARCAAIAAGVAEELVIS